jgi:antitoxin-like ribbon-helix-helix protein
VSKKNRVNFIDGLRSMEAQNAIQRHPPKAAPAPAPTVQEPPPTVPQSRPQSRYGKVAITHFVDPAVRKQLAQLALDYDRSQGEFAAEALNLPFEKYGKPPIAAPMNEDSPVLQPTV